VTDLLQPPRIGSGEDAVVQRLEGDALADQQTTLYTALSRTAYVEAGGDLAELVALLARTGDRAGLQDPFRRAEFLLRELAGWSLDAETLRRCCHRDAAAARKGRGQRWALPEQFGRARGQDRELHVDAGKVNTPEGWRDVKVAVFACRPRGKPAGAEGYEQRHLPAPSARSVVAEVEQAQAFGRRCQEEALRLGVLASVRGVPVVAAGLSVLGDGAGWIWDLAKERFAGAGQTLDVYHGCEQLAKAGRAALGEEELGGWLDGARRTLIGDGYAGVCEVIAALGADAEACRRLGAAGVERSAAGWCRGPSSSGSTSA
jgi:hypothetical protein